MRQLADQRVDLTQREAWDEVALQVAADEALGRGAHLEGGGACLVDRGRTVPAREPEQAQDAAHGDLAVLPMYRGRERADRLARRLRAPEQLDRRERRALAGLAARRLPAARQESVLA